MTPKIRVHNLAWDASSKYGSYSVSIIVFGSLKKSLGNPGIMSAHCHSLKIKFINNKPSMSLWLVHNSLLVLCYCITMTERHCLIVRDLLKQQSSMDFFVLADLNPSVTTSGWFMCMMPLGFVFCH